MDPFLWAALLDSRQLLPVKLYLTPAWWGIRRHAVNFGVPLITNIQLAQRFVEALARKTIDDLNIKSWDEY